MGLPPGATLTRPELARRVDECLGLKLPAVQRSAEQQARVQTIVKVIRIPERSILSYLNCVTWHFHEIVHRLTGGANPFSNVGARYVGSADDADLNERALRYRADPEAVRRFGDDTDLNGRIGVPVLTVHGVNDPTAFVELDSAFLETMKAAGTSERLVQTFTDDNEHSYLSHPVYPTLVEALLKWVTEGVKPTAEGIAGRCPQLEARFGAGCRFLPGYRPAPLADRVTARERP
jgi:pimeloyl-ACP methyl ester carboxylesterase